MQAVFNAVVLSEAVYKATDHGIPEAANIASQLAADVPLPLCPLRSIQWSLPHVRHQYMIGESATCVFVCAIGTKFRSAHSVLVSCGYARRNSGKCGHDLMPCRRDLVTNANVALQPLFDGDDVPSPAAHRGFATRASSIPVERLFDMARYEIYPCRSSVCSHICVLINKLVSYTGSGGNGWCFAVCAPSHPLALYCLMGRVACCCPVNVHANVGGRL